MEPIVSLAAGSTGGTTGGATTGSTGGTTGTTGGATSGSTGGATGTTGGAVNTTGGSPGGGTTPKDPTSVTNTTGGNGGATSTKPQDPTTGGNGGATGATTGSTGDGGGATAPSTAPTDGLPAFPTPDPTNVKNSQPIKKQCNQQGILVSSTVSATDASCVTFTVYVDRFINQVFGLILYLAMALIIFSGIQYMVSNSDKGKQAAKQRIAGIIVGAIFFMIARFILNQIELGLSLTN